MKLHSPAFDAGREIPAKYTCEGANVSPPLAWSNAPEHTKSFVLIVDDPDAPDPAAPRMTWVHWVLYNLPPTTLSLAENLTSLPPGALQGLNDWKRAAYGGPCPPIGRHRYVHKLYALDARLELGRPTKADVEQAMSGHVLGYSELIGTYEKKKK